MCYTPQTLSVTLLRACCTCNIWSQHQLSHFDSRVSHTQLCHTHTSVSHTHTLCHTHTSLSHTTLQTQTCNLKLIDPPPPPLSILPSPSRWNFLFLLVGRQWLDGTLMFCSLRWRLGATWLAAYTRPDGWYAQHPTTRCPNWVFAKIVNCDKMRFLLNKSAEQICWTWCDLVRPVRDIDRSLQENNEFKVCKELRTNFVQTWWVEIRRWWSPHPGRPLFGHARWWWDPAPSVRHSEFRHSIWKSDSVFVHGEKYWWDEVQMKEHHQKHNIWIYLVSGTIH